MTSESQATQTLECELCIVGAGYAALNGLNAAAKYLKKGARVVVIDKNATWGGQWLHQYDFVRLHQPHRMFTAGDQPWNSSRDPSYLATRHEVLAHLATVPSVSAAHLEIEPLFGHLYTGHSIREGRVELTTSPTSSARAPVRVRAKRMLMAVGADIHMLPPFALSSRRIKSVGVSDPFVSSREFLQGSDPVYIIGSGKTAMDTARYLLQMRGARRRPINVIAGSGMWFFVRDNIYPRGLQRYYRGTPNANVFMRLCSIYDGRNEEAAMEVLRRRGHATNVWCFGGNCRLGMISLAECDELRAGVDRVFRGHLVDVEDAGTHTRMTLRQNDMLQEHSVPAGSVFINCTTHMRARAHQPVLQDSGLVCAPQFALGLSGMSAYFLTHLWMRDDLASVAHKLFRMRLDVDPKLAFAPHLGLMVMANMCMVNPRLPMSIAGNFEGDFNRWYPMYRRLPLLAALTKNRNMLLDKAERILRIRFSDAPDHLEPAVGAPGSTEPALDVAN